MPQPMLPLSHHVVTDATRYTLKQLEHTLAPVRDIMKPILSDPFVMGIWALMVVVSVGVLLWDIRSRNTELPSMMKGVWALVVLYSGPFGLAVYWYSGRAQISNDSLWRQGFRSTAHCYSGCGAGEAVGFALLTGVLALQSTLAVTSVSVPHKASPANPT